MGNKQDIFDKMMPLPFLQIFEPFYKKYKEVILYLLFGGATFFINLWLFTLLTHVMKMDALVANVIDWIICVLIQFSTNRTWVFNNNVGSTTELIKQIVSFFGWRLLTLIIEESILAVFIVLMNLNSFVVKLSAQVVVIVLNYVISKWFVFRK